ncbi:hypothetical protein MGN70_013355 [Eutypa lata]|nr:hypothetical protein MGN70_013355 [Eutypa lata]
MPNSNSSARSASIGQQSSTSGSSLQRDLGQGETTLGKGVINGAKPAQTGRLPRSATATKAGNTGRDMTEEDRDAACQQLMEDTLLEKLPLPKQIPVGPTPPIPSKPAGTLPRSATPMNFYAPSPTRGHRSSNGLLLVDKSILRVATASVYPSSGILPLVARHILVLPRNAWFEVPRAEQLMERAEQLMERDHASIKEAIRTGQWS